MRPDDRVGAGTMRVPLVWWWVGAGGRDFFSKASVAVMTSRAASSHFLSQNLLVLKAKVCNTSPFAELLFVTNFAGGKNWRRDS